MSVQLTWSSSNGGSTLADDLSLGSVANGVLTAVQTLYIRHDGAFAITNAGLFIRQYSGDYSGSSTAEDDFAELMSWGDTDVAADFGGFMLNLDAAASFPAGWWPTGPAAKDISSGGKIVGTVCRSIYGGDSLHAVPVITNMGCSADGQIQAGSAPNVRLGCRVFVPTSESATGFRLAELVLAYDYTS